jgi:hypothetical protein
MLTRDVIIQKLERLLTHWIDSHNQHDMNFSFPITQEKAMSLYKDLKLKAQEEGIAEVEDYEFKASHGEFERFKTCADLHSLRISGERASADVAAGTKFPKELMMIIDGGDYLPNQIFNVADTVLFWKRMPP